ncbi:MAG: hypothetical protein FJ011_24125 [Chloroflexi bacterium]|nr:hypothetical protein [Chloroflexota bacterium]
MKIIEDPVVARPKPIKPRKADPKPADKLYPPGKQCPHCGGFKISIKKTESVGDHKYDSVMEWLSRHNLHGLYDAIAILFGLTLIGIPVTIFMMNLALKDGYVEHHAKYSYECLLCGNAWEWHNDSPWPYVFTRPDLVRLGETKLQQEALAQQQAQRDAEALYYLTHC